MVAVLTCPACGFDPYDMIFYAIKQEFPDNNPRDVIEEMYKSGEYKDEADFYIFENHIDYCPNQDKLMKISAGFDTEDEAFNYAYNEGHAASRKNAPYKPNPSGKTAADFKKIYKQRAESFPYKPNPSGKTAADFKKIYKQRAESFAAPYAGAGSLMGIGQDTGLGSFTSKELTESSAIHGDFDSASLNYSGKQNLEVRAEASDSYDNLAHQEDMALEAYEEYVQELDPATDYPPMSFEDWYEQTMAIYDTPEYDKYLEQQYLQMQENEEELERQLKTLEADWRDLPRDSAGRWTRITPEEPETIDAYIDIQPAQSGNFPLPAKEQETFSQSQVTLRELSEMMNTLTGNLLGFDMAYRTVIDMLGSKDTPERREALLSTMEETIMTLEFYEETGYDGDIQMMVDIMRQNGMAPPPQFEEEVMARYQFEDKYAAEDKKILKPEVPADYNLQQTFGNNMVLMAEGLEEDRNSPAFEKWEEKFYLCYHDWQDDELHVDTFDEKYQITAYCSLCDATMLLTNLHIGDNGPDVIELPGRRPLLDFYDTSQEAYAAEEDEGPTIEDFFRDISKVLNKYGEFSWDSQLDTYYPDDLMIFFKGTLKPHNDADYFFQYDEDFSE